jgi:hypothetical protein
MFMLDWFPSKLGLGGSELGAARMAVAVMFVATAVMTYALARRMGVRIVAAVAVTALFVLSPLSLELGRQVYLDNIALPWLLLAFWLAASPSHSLAGHIAAGLTFAVACLSKETFALTGPALLYLLWQHTHHRNRVFSVVGFLVVGGLTLLFYPLMGLLRGELLPGEGHVSLWDGLTFQFGRVGSGYVWQDGSSKSGLLAGWMGADAILLWGGLVAAAVCLIRRQTRWISIALGMLALPVVATAGYLPAMYIIVALPFLALGIGVVLDRGWTLASRRVLSALQPRLRSVAGMVAAVLVVCALPLGARAGSGERYADLLGGQSNREWQQMLNHVERSVDRDAVIVVPFSMWPDLERAGWAGPWRVIAAEKIDLDPIEFARFHPQGWASIDYIVYDPVLAAKIEDLNLAQLRQAVANSEVVASFGAHELRKMRAGTTDRSQKGTTR